jgi:choline dehydrogenase-like flavoprotein/predicted ester cyclase
MTANEAAIRKAYQVAENRDVAGWVNCFTETGTFTDESIGVTYRGQEPGRTVETYAAAFPDMHRELYRFYEAGDTVIVELALQGTHQGPLSLPTGTVPPTGKRMDAPCCDVFRLENGEIQSVWTRGMQRDYDGWAENGAKGWSFADVLPVFKSQEDWESGANDWRGAGGPIHIRRPKDPHPTAPAFLNAAREMGMPIHDDVNGPMLPGAGYINMNIAADGTRVSAARAFLHPALSRPNLTLWLNAQVVKLNFNGTRCVGVKLIQDGAIKDVAADKEVILAAGAINSPKLLMLSGVGDAKALRSLGIEVVADAPGVGKNLQDHVLVSGVVFKYKGKMPARPADSNAVEAEAYLSSGPSADTDINLVLEQLPAVTSEAAARFGTPPEDAFTIAPALVQPTSRGAVHLASNNYQDAAVIDGNYLGTDNDFGAVVRAIEAARELGNQHAFDSVRDAELMPGPKATAEDIRDLARLASASFGHPVGTYKIGVDKLAVVDSQLRVHGLLGLRVADASVMPRIITGPTNAPTHMIAGRAAQLILGHHA